jgi:protein-disulfide isomerase
MRSHSKTVFGPLQWTNLVLLFSTVSVILITPAAGFPAQVLGGSLDSPVRIEVFSDFQCPSCRELYLDVMRRVLVEYSKQNKVCVIYHEFPLPTHQYSWEAARYAEAAGRLGQQKMLMVYDALYMNQSSWAQDGKLDAAISKVLSREDLQKLKKIMQDPGINAAIEKGVQLARQNRLNSTPTFFIYSGQRQLQKVEGRLTFVSLKQYLDRILQ